MENTNPVEQNLTTPPAQPPVENKKMTAGLCAILVGGFGVHKFVLGYNTEGAIILVTQLVMIIITFITCGFGIFITGPIMGLIGTLALIEGIIYLNKSDEEFYETYQKNKKSWF